ncbi:unnamed protein product [Closterium sp. NIES-53]
MASLRVLVFHHEGRPIKFDTWLNDLQLYLLSDSKDSVSLFDHTSGAATAPPTTANSATRSQWLTCDAAARLAIRNHLPLTECTHFGHHRTAKALYNAVVARYSSPATAALGRPLLPYQFPELSALATVEDLVSHLRTSDARYRAAAPADFLDRNQPPMFITLNLIVTRLPDSLRSVRDHILTLNPTVLTSDLLEQHLLTAETSVVAVGAARGTPRTPFFEGCSPSPLAPSYASTADVDVPGAAHVGAASDSGKRRSSKGKGGRGGGSGSGGGGGGSSGGGGGSSGGGIGGSGGGSGGFGGGGGGSGGSGGSGSGGSGGGRNGAQRRGSGGGQRQQQQQQRRSETPSPQQPQFADEAKRPRWAELLRSGVAIFALDYDAILAAMYALSVSAEGDCYLCVPPDLGIEAAALGASESVLRGTASAEALHTFTLDSGASRCFFRDSTTLTPLSALVPVRLADPSRGPVLACSSIVLPCPAVLSGSLSGLHLPLFSMNLVSTAALQDAMVTTTTPGGQRVLICTCTQTSHHVATIARRPGSSLYTLATEPPQVVASAQVFASGQRAAPHSSSFPPTTAPLQTLHMDVWGPARVSGQGRKHYFLLVVDDYTQYTTVFPLRSKGQDLPVLCLHSVRCAPHWLSHGGCSYLHDPCGCSPFSVAICSPDGDALVFQVWGSRAFVRDTSADKLSARAIPYVFLGFSHDVHSWQFDHPTLRRVFPSQDVTFDELVPFYRLFPYHSAPPPPPPLFLAQGPPPVDPLPPKVRAPSGDARGAVSGGAEPGGAKPAGAEPAGVEPVGAESKSVEPRGAESEGAESGGAEPRGAGDSTIGDTGAGGAGVTAGAGGIGGAIAAGPGGARTCGTRAAGTGGVGGAGAGDPTEPGAVGAGGAGAVGAEAGGTKAGGARDFDPGAGGAGGTMRPQPYFVPLLQQVLGVPSSSGLTPPLLCPQPDHSQLPLQPASLLPGPSPYTEVTGGLIERREPAIRPASSVSTGRCVSCRRPPPVPGTHTMALRPSSLPLRVPLPTPPESSLPTVPAPESGRARAASPTVCRLLATAINDPSFQKASWKSRGTYVDAVPPSQANIVDGMWIFMVKRPPGSPPAFKARYFARGFSQRQGFEYFDTFSTTPKMTTLCVLLHVAAQCDYELNSLDFSTAFLQGSLHVEIWLRRPRGFTGSFPAGTQWSLRGPVYGLRQAPREWHDTLRPTFMHLGFTPLTADLSLFLRTDTSLPPFYVLEYIDDLVFATADTEELTLVKSELQKRHTCTDLGELRSYLGLQITRDIARRTITLTQPHMVHQVLQRFGFQFSSPQPTPLSTSHSLSAPPSDKSVEPSGPYPELVSCLMYVMTCTRPDLAYPLSLLARYVAPCRHRKVHWDAAKRVLRYLCSMSGMGLVLGGRGPVVLTGHADASWVDDLATQRSSQGYTFSLGSGSVSWRSTRSSSVLSSSCEAEIYARAMAAQELRWLTYLLTDLGDQPCSPPVVYVDNKAMIALYQQHRLEHRTKHIALRDFLAR